jgi:hypothetical protein
LEKEKKERIVNDVEKRTNIYKSPSYVILAAASTFILNFAHIANTGKYRRAAGVKYPNAYASDALAKEKHEGPSPPLPFLSFPFLPSSTRQHPTLFHLSTARTQPTIGP